MYYVILWDNDEMESKDGPFFEYRKAVETAQSANRFDLWDVEIREEA